MNKRVTVRVNMTTAGVGEQAQVYTTDDSPLLQSMAEQGIVTVLSTEPDEGAGSSSGATETAGTDAESATEGDSNEAPKREARGSARKNKRRAATGGDQ